MDFRFQFPRPHMEGEEEEDLEALRLAALQSLKRKASEEASNPPGSHNYNGIARGPRKRGRYYQNLGRPGNGQFSKGWSQSQFSSRIRNTNLISITPQTDGSSPSRSNEEESPPKLILPQDRYNKLLSEADKPSGSPVSKFDRYDNSDKSESEEEEESEQSDQGTLKRANSLEDLLKELDYEIQGESKNKESKPSKNKVKRKKSQPKIVTEDVQSATCDSSENNSHGKQATSSESSEKNSSEIDSTTKVTQIQQPNESLVKKETFTQESDEVQHSDNRFNRHRLNRSPNHRKSEFHRRNKRNFHNQCHPFPQPVVTQNPPFPPFLPFNNIDSGFSLPSGGFVPTNIPPPALPLDFIPNRPVSPLAVDTDSINAVITAPLSPRSAAFVLENRAIIEKRKRSPRRSYSRSPSPRNRYSISPRRSFSPRGSLSPRQRRPSRGSLSPRRFSRSPKRRSRSPRRSLSPIRRRSPMGRRHSPKRPRANPAPLSKSSVHNRLGTKSISSSSKAESKTTVENEKINKSEVTTSTSNKEPNQAPTPSSTLDPVLEARRRKFESNEIKLKEGVIRLKPKETKVEQVQKEPPPKSTTPEKPFPLKLSPEKANTEKQNPESLIPPEGVPSNIPNENIKIKETDVDDKLDSLSDLMEDELLAGDDALDLEAPIEHLLSDVDSDPENEGRFKEKTENKPKVPVLPFTKLINGQKSRGKETAKSQSNRRNPERRTASSKSYSSNYSRRRSRTPDGPIPARLSEPAVQSKVKGIENESRYEKKTKISGKLPPKSRSAQKPEKPPLTTPIESKRIEIKIRNPSKYKKVDSSSKSLENPEKSESKSNYIRKVEITKRESSDNAASSSESDTEIVIENEDESALKLDEKEVTSSDGDLRAQLSRKRAERQQYPEVERSSRLLQSALEGAVFKKSKKSKKDKEAKKDVKLPIHLRLGIANTSEVYTVKKKKSKKHRKHNVEQV